MATVLTPREQQETASIAWQLGGYNDMLRLERELKAMKAAGKRPSHAAMSNETLSMIGRLLRHRSLSSTSRYAHLGEEHVSGAAQQIDSAIERLMI